MPSQDSLQKFIFEEAAVRGELIHLHETVKTIVNQHAYPNVIKKLLSEALVITALLAAMIKFNGRLTLQFQGKGRVKLVVVQANHALELRGIIQAQDPLSEAELLDELASGTLAITIDPDNNPSGRYQGIIAFEGHSLAQSVEAYFKYSEQLKTRIWVAIGEDYAAGLLLQVLPEQEPEKHEEDWQRLIYLTETVKPEELMHLENETLLYRLFSEENVSVFNPAPVSFKCDCSVEKSENAILLLGSEEAYQELKGKKQIVVTCEFCNHDYAFNRHDVDAIFNQHQRH